MDVIVAVDGKPVETSRDLTTAVAALPVDEKVRVRVVRNGKTKQFKVVIAERPNKDRAGLSSTPERETLGLRVTPATPETARRFGHAQSETGLLVLAVEPDSKAARMGFAPGDLIKEVDGNPVTRKRDLRGVDLDKAKVLVKRPGEGLKVLRMPS
jgi:serine protease Do